jgi:hypothetical protein
MNYHHKYLKYKLKYLNLKGGNTPTKEPLLPQTPNQPIKLPENITASSEYTPEKNNCNTILQKLKEEIEKYTTNVNIIYNYIEFIKNGITYLILCESSDKHHYLKLLLKNNYSNYNTSKINKQNKYIICKISMHDGQSSEIDTKTGIHAQTNLNKRSVDNSNLLFENKHYIFDNNFISFNDISRIFCGLFMDMMNNDRNNTNLFQKQEFNKIRKKLF